MNQSVENLLKPRYKVIADYPLANFSVGEVFDLCTSTSGTLITRRNVVKWTPDVFNETKLNQYPSIFKKLSWWEDRAVDDMPLYILPHPQILEKGEPLVWKVIKWALSEFDGRWSVKFSHQDYFEWLPESLPVTESEYQEYLKSKK